MSRMVVMAVPGRLGRQFRSPFWFMAFYSLSLASHKKAKNECLAWIILISSGSVGLDFLKWFKNFNTCLLVIS